MLSIGEELLLKIVQSNDLKTFSDIKEEWLVIDSEKKIYNQVKSYWDKYKQFPPISLIHQEEVKVEGDIQYYKDEFINRGLTYELRKIGNDVTRIMSRSGTEALQKLTDFVTTANSWVNQASDRYITPPKIRAMLLEYIHKCRMSETDFTGIPFGWPTLDSTTGGAQNGDIVVFVARPGMGKALRVDEKVVTKDGYKEIGKLEIGEEIASDDGKFYKVSGIYPQGCKDLYRISFSDNTEIICTADHLWETSNRYEKVGEGKIRNTLSIERTLMCKGGTHHNHKVKMCKPVEFGKKELLLDPYYMGVLLGDGGFTQGTIQISNSEIDIIDRLVVPEEDYLIKRSENDYFIQNKRKWKKSKTKDCIEVYGLLGKYSYEKHIPRDYLFSSVEDRLKLLQGLLDTDGYISGTGIDFSTTSFQLKEDIIFLVHSLGGLIREIKKEESHYIKNGERIECRKSYRLYISFDNVTVIPVSSVKHLNKLNVRSKYPMCRYIENVEKIGKGEAVCIRIDSPSHLFLSTNFTVTHNSMSLIYLADVAYNFGKKVLFVSMEMTALQIGKRWASLRAQIPADALKFGKVSSEVEEKVVSCLHDDDRFVIIEGNFDEKWNKIHLMIADVNPDIVYIDAAYLIDPDTKFKTDWESMKYVMKKIKTLSFSDKPIPIVVSFQMNRASEKDKKKSVSGIAVTDFIGQTASIVILIQDTEDEKRRILETLKDRDGQSGTLWECNWDFKNCMNFKEIEN